MASYLYWILSPISNYTRSYFQPQTIVTQPTLIVAQNILSAPPAESASIDKKNWTKGDSAIPDDVLLKAGLPFDKEQPLELIIHQLQPLVETGSISKHQMLEIIIHHAALQNVDSVLNDNLNALFELDTPNDVTTGYIHCFLKK